MMGIASPLFAAIVAAALLALAGAVHFYWALGGAAGKAGAIPSIDGTPLLRPSAVVTAGVGFGLIACAAFVLVLGGLSGIHPPLIVRLGGMGIALIFLIRAIGDFRTVGFFKRIKGSLFATRDTWVYSPLCVLLATLVGRAAVG